MDLRARRISASLDLSGCGLEYGPLHRAIALKSPSCKVQYIDYATRELLVEKYQDDPVVDTSLIPEIDIVTDGSPISRFVKSNTQDFIIASHVLEHVPDFVGWLKDNLDLLRTGGRIAVAFPDRRYCFDFAKQKTMVSDLIAAHLEKRTQPNFTQICDHIVNTRNVLPADIWRGDKTPENSEPVHKPDHIVGILRDVQKRTDYIDVHCWKFADEELVAALEEVKFHFALPFNLIGYFPTQMDTSEFYLTLEKT